MSELNKSELEVMLQVITRNTEQLSIVAENNKQQADRLKEIMVLQEKTNARLYNGMAKEITAGVVEAMNIANAKCSKYHDTLATTLGKIETTSGDIKADNTFVKWFVGIVGTVIIIAVVVIKTLDSRIETNTKIKTLVEQVK